MTSGRGRMMKVLRACVLAIIVAGCNGGGGNCPWERPSCCDNNLFGCGPFDLPQGCSCGDYSSRSFQGFPLMTRAAPPPSTSLSMNGTWRLALQKNGSACTYLSKQSTSTVLVRERKQQVSMKLVGFTTLRGNRIGKALKPRGRMRIPHPKCSAEVDADVTLTGPATANVVGTVTVTCLDQSLSCTTTYRGNLKKL